VSSENIDLIESHLKSRNVEEYEIYFMDRKAYESIFLKNKVEIERDINDFEYILRILSHKQDQTGVGIVKSNSLDPKEIGRNIDLCILYSKHNLSSKYNFPSQSSIPNISMADPKIINDPLGIKNDLVEDLLKEVQQQKEVVPTFGRFRIHNNKTFLRNSNSVDLNSQKTYFVIEFSLKAQKNERLAEYWPFIYIKEMDDLNLSVRVKKWAELAKASLVAKIPKPEKSTTIIFSPRVLQSALNGVIGEHATGKAYHEKLSLFNFNDNIASENLTIIDDGLLKGGLSSNGWDGEGSPRQRSEIIVRGVFKKRIYDQKYAMLEDEISTGNGNRTDDGAVVNGISNFEILPGDLSLDEMISNISSGYLLEQFSWLMPDPISGTFGSEIRNGFYIKNGKIEYPVKLGNVSGNIFQMIKNCKYISKEREFLANNLFPYIAFENLTVSS